MINIHFVLVELVTLRITVLINQLLVAMAVTTHCLAYTAKAPPADNAAPNSIL